MPIRPGLKTQQPTTVELIMVKNTQITCRIMILVPFFCLVASVQAAPAEIVEGEGGLDLSIEADNHKNVYFSFTCTKKSDNFILGSLVLHFSDDTKFSPPIQNLITEAQRLKDDHTINMSLCLNEKCQKVKWGKDDLSGGYYTKIRLDYGKPITSIKVIPKNIPQGIYSKTSITKKHLDQICE